MNKYMYMCIYVIVCTCRPVKTILFNVRLQPKEVAYLIPGSEGIAKANASSLNTRSLALVSLLCHGYRCLSGKLDTGKLGDSR